LQHQQHQLRQQAQTYTPVCKLSTTIWFFQQELFKISNSNNNIIKNRILIIVKVINNSLIFTKRTSHNQHKQHFQKQQQHQHHQQQQQQQKQHQQQQQQHAYQCASWREEVPDDRADVEGEEASDRRIIFARNEEIIVSDFDVWKKVQSHRVNNFFH
jgi:ABC-type nickel/cobalt efflux system permease component RcnA